MSGFDEYVKTGLIEKDSAFETWYKASQNDIEDEYQEYVAETKRLGEKPMDKKKWAKEIFESQTVMETMDVPTKHQLNVAMKTIKTPAAMLGVMGGMSYKDAIAFFRKIKYSDDKIKKLLAAAGHKENEIKDLMENVGEPEIKKLQDKIEKEYDKYVTETTDRGDTPASKREWARKILKSKTVEESTKIERLTLSLYINKILNEGKTVKLSKPLYYTEKDFIITKEEGPESEDPGLKYHIETKDGVVQANVLWKKGKPPEIRAMIGTSASLHIIFPLSKAEEKLPPGIKFLNPIIQRLSHGEYN